MRFSAALVAGLAVTTSAFLIPLEVANDAIEDAEFKDTQFKDAPKYPKDPITALISDRKETVNLDCPGCPFAFEYSVTEGQVDGIKWMQNVENKIHLEFTTHNSALQINGQTVFPFAEAQKEGLTTIKAHQISTKADTMKTPEVPLNFGLEVLPKVAYEGENSVTEVQFTVLALNGIPVKVGSIVLDLIEHHTDGIVSIARTRIIPFSLTPGAQSCDGAPRWGLCRIRAMIAARLKSMMEAAKEHADKVKGWAASKGKKFGGCRKGGQFRQGHPHHRHHRHHRLGRILHQVLRFFVIPAVLGIIGGLTASAIGMLVGQFIVFLWHRNYRRGQRGPLRVVEQEVIIFEEEKDGLLSEQPEEAPPMYQDDVEATPADAEKQ